MDSPSKVAAESKQRLNIGLHPTSSANVTRQDKASEKESSLSDSASTHSLSNTTGIDNDFRQRQITAINSRLYGNGCSRIGGASKAPSRGKQSNTASQRCYITGYNLNSTGTMVGVDGKSIGQKPNVSIVGCTASIKLRHPDPIKTSGTFSSSFTGYSLDSKHLKSSNKVPQSTSDFLSSALYRASYSSKNGSSQSNHTQGSLHNGPSNYSPNGQIGPRTDGYKMGEKSNTHYSFEALKESSRGPRSRKLHSLSCLKDENDEHFGPRVRRDRYNRSDFQIIYDNAKFFIIKSYNEEDIHKSIKYDVWSSTPNGNNKLNAAFHDVEAKYGEKGSKCPIFLFFSVNGSGQFLGIAEMVGPVDFEKTMDFWQQDKWSGFFPITWHIIKDIPNPRLRHIILENNDCKPVTYTRDTQEVGLKQGLEMLSIFKNYVAVTSMLDDYKFYEDREKSLQVRKCIKEESPECCRTAYLGNGEERSMKANQVSVRTKNTSDSYTSLASLARKLSLNDNNSRAGR